jgi:hypothetical protein
MEECVASILAVAFGTAVATDYISLPPHIVGHPVVTILMVLFGVVAFVKYPVLGIAIFLTAAIILFKRNTQAARAFVTYGVDSIRRQPRADAEPSQSLSSNPRQYDQFQETDAANPMHAVAQEGFEPAPYGNEELNENVEGAFPIGAARVSASADSSEYVYHPDTNTGSNAFERFGPDMDEKKAFAY